MSMQLSLFNDHRSWSCRHSLFPSRSRLWILGVPGQTIRGFSSTGDRQPDVLLSSRLARIIAVVLRVARSMGTQAEIRRPRHASTDTERQATWYAM